MAELKLVLFLLVHSANCAFFDFPDIDDPLSLFWQSNKDFAVTSKNSPCIVSIPGHGSLSVATGQCRHKTLCLLSGGQAHAHDNCGSFLTCCTQSVICSKRTKAKVSLFTNDATNLVPDCEYIVEAKNDNVCQMRLDFEQFHFAPAKEVSAGDIGTPPVATARTECYNDYLTVTPSVYNIPPFCGNNDGQHVYVQLHSQRELRLRVHLVGRSSTQDPDILSVPNPKWRIRVTQLECPTSQNFFLTNKYYGLDSDLHLLAPEGATQYFLETRGRIRSFGFNGQESDYISGLNYGISFKRRPNMNCIWFTTNYITLRHTAADNDTSPTVCTDFLFVPDFHEVSGGIYRFESQLCDRQIADRHPDVFYLNAPGPFNIFFHSEPTHAPGTTVVRAFDINYEMRNC